MIFGYRVTQGEVANHHDKQILLGNICLDSNVVKEREHCTFTGWLYIPLDESAEINCYMPCSRYKSMAGYVRYTGSGLFGRGLPTMQLP